jgi:hypothetical protein
MVRPDQYLVEKSISNSAQVVLTRSYNRALGRVASHIYLTPRRGRKALSPVDKLYLRHINNNGVMLVRCPAKR